MLRTQYTQEEIARIAEEKYRREIRDKVMPQHRGKFLTLEIESGDYEIDEDDLSGVVKRDCAPGTRMGSSSASGSATKRPTR
jgi:hypothetical protein